MSSDNDLRPPSSASAKNVLARTLADGKTRYGHFHPDADEILTALDLAGFEVVEKGHPGCVAALDHVKNLYKHDCPRLCPMCARVGYPISDCTDCHRDWYCSVGQHTFDDDLETCRYCPVQKAGEVSG